MSRVGGSIDLARSRWTYLAVACAGALLLLAGCVGGNVSQEDDLQVDRPANSEGACTEVDVLDDSESYVPKVLPIGDHGTTWPIDLRSGEAVKLSIFWAGSRERAAELGLADLKVVDPEGAVLLEKDGYSSNHHTVTAETDGTYKITMENPALTKGGMWRLEVHWYPDVDCT